MFTNTIEQNYIPHAMAYSACEYLLFYFLKKTNTNFYFIFIIGIGPYENEECKMQRGILQNPKYEKLSVSVGLEKSNGACLNLYNIKYFLCLFIFYLFFC